MDIYGQQGQNNPTYKKHTFAVMPNRPVRPRVLATHTALATVLEHMDTTLSTNAQHCSQHNTRANPGGKQHVCGNNTRRINEATHTTLIAISATAKATKA